jgi:hypothetical protein
VVNEIGADCVVHARSTRYQDFRSDTVATAYQVIRIDRVYTAEQAELGSCALAECLGHVLTDAFTDEIQGIDIDACVLV